ncbi:type II toxin-antitoxin system antitoxin SocA domain-containing protein [Arcicella sp. LKC2W]|uniref:Panacea domain-containing protein n=1 Tax=Arcicella sp. LKC2W TaxID=2984198 RepID=UPI002B21F9CA|nr:type II toxin-antitoxin system antitoxin SocA domain-containing protein [Arcicella sp. LKC2W]MEA5459411.1 type II toxin-antitoxin system antitoxin SocA domain-containing protein [Arcicella sp. LKC2W]
MENTIDILAFSEYLVNHFNYYQEPITNKKLQKLLYYIQGWHLAYLKTPLFDATLEAWVHGPVYPSVYNKFKSFQFQPLCITNEEPSLNSLAVDIRRFDLTSNQQDLINSVLNHYGGKSAFELEMRSHNEKPWLEAREGLSDIDLSQNQINIATMKSFFESKLQEK